MDNLDKVILGSGVGATLLYWGRVLRNEEVNIYKSDDGKILWWKFFINFWVHIGVALFGAWLFYISFNLSALKEYAEYQVIGSVIGGLIAREILPLGLEFLIEEFQLVLDKRRAKREYPEKEKSN